ncbi:MAG TPA: sigma-70 family RNA polymerase sigma factor [Chthonomonadaceae bacterium]|nr:sigma-70 family RNA polymerase sigma factor [Chthonomonadaceae bacterium]
MDQKAEERRTLEALEQFAGEDTSAAAAAFDWLFPRIERFLYHVYKTTSLPSEEIADLIQEVRIRAWERRRTFRNLGFAAWLGWLRRVAHNLMVDRFRKRGPEVTIERTIEDENGDEDPEDLPILDLMIRAIGAELYHLADVIWLELDETLSQEEHHRRLLAAQLYYQDQWSAEEILAHFSHAHPILPPLPRAALNAWLSHGGTLRHLAFHELYYAPEHLAAHLLGLPEETDASALNALLAAAQSPPDTQCPCPDWTWEETRMILWRYFREVTLEEWKQYFAVSPDDEVYSAFFTRCAEYFPFLQKAIALQAWLEGLPALGEDREKILGKPKLWQRLAFEYRYRRALPLRDIHERTAPPAQQVGYQITSDMLNTWLSGKQLLNKLVQRFAEREPRGGAYA